MSSSATDYRAELASLAAGNEKFVAFTTKVINTKKKILGVRTLDFKKLARQMTKEMGVGEVEDFLTVRMRKGIYEDVALATYMIAHVKMSDEERIRLTKIWLSSVDTWALTDSDAEKLPAGFDDELWWEFIEECLASTEEFTVRFGVMLMFANYRAEPARVFAALRRVRHNGYYVKMAMAWTYAELAVGHFDDTLTELQNANIDTWTRRKALTKMAESRRFTPTQKATIRDQRASIQQIRADCVTGLRADFIEQFKTKSGGVE